MSSYIPPVLPSAALIHCLPKERVIPSHVSLWVHILMVTFQIVLQVQRHAIAPINEPNSLCWLSSSFILPSQALRFILIFTTNSSNYLSALSMPPKLQWTNGWTSEMVAAHDGSGRIAACDKCRQARARVRRPNSTTDAYLFIPLVRKAAASVQWILQSMHQ